ncbi:MAG: type II toxin-antitoxin system Phd/YefM family antitoxin [Nostoc sp. NMS7]|uniref:type II toxin-antitoxin system Phd/YefM family antitoxin n=1 Tax=Nostoc sp. NMS7 TaxID=2815391 RepID=UPI0025E8E361|nr:type II toxin-antitoxin system Phd/YefM family antitoxin [Nostoc sp. NMS7]MBN3951302.1 type II toxin-antitoxin system Phd/YefM family antitoxin [Nostoc sp. NMS7]
MEHIATSELPETLQQIFAEIQRTKTPLTVTHEGEPLVIIYPATPQPHRPAFAVMKGSGEILGEVIAPVIPANTWEALQ